MIKANNKANLLVMGGIDPTAHAGVLQDIKVANYFQVDCAAVISANTVQNDGDFIALNVVDDSIFYEQFTAIVNIHKPQVIKSGVLGSVAHNSLQVSWILTTQIFLNLDS